jgi:hypothetical protein
VERRPCIHSTRKLRVVQSLNIRTNCKSEENTGNRGVSISGSEKAPPEPPPRLLSPTAQVIVANQPPPLLQPFPTPEPFATATTAPVTMVQALAAVNMVHPSPCSPSPARPAVQVTISLFTPSIATFLTTRSVVAQVTTLVQALAAQWYKHWQQQCEHTHWRTGCEHHLGHGSSPPGVPSDTKLVSVRLAPPLPHNPAATAQRPALPQPWRVANSARINRQPHTSRERLLAHSPGNARLSRHDTDTRQRPNFTESLLSQNSSYAQSLCVARLRSDR